MPKARRKLSVDERAKLAEGVSHAFRFVIMDILTERKRLPMAELRRLVEEAYMPIETRNLQFHVFKMQMCGLVKMEREGNRDHVELVRVVTLEVDDA